LKKRFLQRFALKPKPRKFLKALQRNAFKNFLVVRLIGNCYKLTSVRVNFKLAPREGSQREPSLGAKTVKASLREAFTVLAFKIL
jgi:hypothetical protein